MRLCLGSAIALVSLSLALAGCRGRLETFRDDLSLGRTASNAPRCSQRADLPQCLENAAKFFAEGAHFNPTSPDQATAAAVALLVTDGNGAWLEGSGVWLASAKQGKGAGGDALRIAVAAALTRQSATIAYPLVTDEDATRLFLAVSRSIPGACGTYALLATGGDGETLPIADSPDHAACVQADLMRTGGPGGAYGFGRWRAAAGALALWKDAVRDLEIGTAAMSGPSKERLKTTLNSLRDATSKITVKAVDRPIGNQWSATDHAGGPLPAQ